MAEWSSDIAMMIPHTMPAITIRTAAGKLNDDAFMFVLHDCQLQVWRPI